MNNNIEFERLTRNQEKLIASLSRRKKRKEHGLCICEGLRGCTELYRMNPSIILYAVISEEYNSTDLVFFSDIQFYTLPVIGFKRLTSTVNSQGILFITRIPDFEEIISKELPFVLILDRIADPGNFGTIMRTALSVGLKELWYSAGTVDPFSEKTIRSALGAQFKLKLNEYDNLHELLSILESKGYSNIFRTDVSGGDNCFETEGLFDKSVIIFGNEANGVENIAGSVPLHIPMPGGFESLNVAQAVTVILFDAVRRKVL